MKQRQTRFLERMILQRTRAYWDQAAKDAAKAPLATLRAQREDARLLRHKLDMLIHQADHRLSYPRIGGAGFAKPIGTDWVWRPQPWHGALSPVGVSAPASGAALSDDVAVFHDSQTAEFTLRQIRNTREADQAPFGVKLDVFRFDGSFFSLVLHLPDDACVGLTRQNLLRLELILELERPLRVFARLNVRHGPNTEQIVREVSTDGRPSVVEFDLAYTKMNEKRIESAWVDLILEDLEMTQVILRDVTLSRSPRADV